MSKISAPLSAKISTLSQVAKPTSTGAMRAEALAVEPSVTEADALLRRKKLQQTSANLDGSDSVLDPSAVAELTQAAVGDGGSVLLAQVEVVPEAPAAMGTTGSAATASAAPSALGVGAGIGWISAAAVGLAAMSNSKNTSGTSNNNSNDNSKDNTPLTRSGSVIDGYLSGATVFIDADGDGQLDDGEPNTVTDDKGNFSLPVTPAGNLVAIGGTDMSTGLPFVGMFRAPAGSSVVTPLTTLVSELMSNGTTTAAQAQETVLKSLGLGSLVSTIDLTNYDPLKQPSGDATALAIQKANVNVATLVSQLTSKLQSTTNAADSQQDEIARDVYKELSGLLTVNALATGAIGDTTGLLVDAVGTRSSIGGQTLDAADKDTLKSDKPFLMDSAQALAKDLDTVTDLSEIGDLQKDALTVPTTTAQVTGIADNVGSVTGNVVSGGTTDDTSLVIAGTLGGAAAGASLAAGESVRIYDGSTYLGNATVTVVNGGQSTWSYTDSRTLTDAQALSYSAQVSDAAGKQSAAGTAYTATVDTSFTLQLLHFSDAEAGTLASQTAHYLAAMVDKFEDQYANSITLAGGDNVIPGPFLAAGTDAAILSIFNRITGSTVTGNLPVGAVDIALHNLIGVEASAIGNHEFDLGSRTWSDSIKPTASYKGALFPHISANLDFSGDSDLRGSFVDTTATAGLEKAANYKGKLVPSAILEEGGEKIGLVGATTQILENISSPSGTKVKDNDSIKSDDMDLLAAQLQPVINDLISQGVNKIILLAHLQILGNELALAGKLSGVDIIMAAGSNTRLGDADDKAVEFPGHAANFANTYPVQLTDKDGNTTVVVNTDNEFTYLGRLVVDFDASGKIITDSLTKNTAINGAYASTAENAAAAWGVSAADLDTTALADGTRGGNVKALTSAVQDVITVKDSVIYGQSNVYLEGERTQVRSQETNLGNLSADANTYVAQQALGTAAASTFVVSLKNGGGIRTQIGTISAPKEDGTVDKLPPDGGVSQLDVENSLRFNNQLMMFDTTAQGLKAILEHGVAAGTLQGRFPQLGGVAFSWDPDFAAGSRVNDIALVGDGYRINLYDNGVLLDSVPQTISVVTLSFLANGGDSYPIKANGENFRYVVKNADGSYTLTTAVDESLNLTQASSVPGGLTPLGEQAAFEAYMKAFHATTGTAYNQADTPDAGDTRIQNLNFRSEEVLDVPVTVSYSETFNTLAASGTASTVPAGWSFTEAGTGMNTTYTAGTGSSNSGNTYSFGTGTDTDRALGALQSGSVSSTLSASFLNTTGKVVYTAQIQYTGEQWRLGFAGREDRLDVEYSQDGTTWVEANALDFVAPVTAGTVGALDGNAAANSRAVSATLTGLKLASGASLQVRWKDFNATSSDDGLAIDDVSVTLSSAWSAAPVIAVPAVPAKINAIQGEGASSAMVGQSVIVEARITAVLPDLGMFYVQEETADQDSNALTSEGLAVYYGTSNPGVTAANVGDVVRLTGTVTEFNGMTQLTSPTALSVVTDGSAASLDAAVQVKLPIASGTTLERFEGMLIEVSANSGGDLYVADTYTFARYGETTLYADAVPYQYTEQNAPSVTGNTAYQDALLRNRIQIEDGRSSENPSLAELNAGTRILRDTSVDSVSNGTALGAQDGTGVNFVRVGDTAKSVTGVLGYSFGQYELQPTQTVNLTASVRPTGSPDVGAAEVKVASFNLLNYFTTLGTANFTTPSGNSIAARGATTADEFTQQQAKIVEAIVATGAHVLGLNELQNNGSADGSAIDALVDALNAKVGSAKFAYVSGHATGTDAIRVGLIYDQTVVKTQGNAQTPDTATYTAFAADNRIPVAQTFSYLNDDGKQFTVVVNHLKSKGSAASLPGDADAGDGQGLSNATRVAAVNNLDTWLATNPTGTASDNVILLGDLNAYRKEDPIRALENAGFTHQGAPTDYSYVFSGLRGSLDHVMSKGLSTAEVTGVVHFNINSDEQIALDYNDEYGDGSVMKNLDGNDMYKSSDHDPVVIGLKLDPVLAPALAIGDVRFLAANADTTDAFAFAVLKAISAGTSVGFTDRNYSQANGMPSTGESAFVWTADKSYGAGTVVTIQPDAATGTNPIADKGTVQGAGGGISTNSETIYAFLGDIAGLGNGTAGAITLNTLLASINVGGTAAGDVPTAIAATSVSFAPDNVKYNGAMDFTNINTFVTQLNNTTNWATNDTVAFTLTSNSLFPAV